MSNMQVFYKNIKATEIGADDPYLSSLKKLTHIDRVQLQSIATDLWWSDWAAPISDPTLK